jgi:hypothetical protein
LRIDLGDGDWAELRHANKIPHSRTLDYRKVFFRNLEQSADIAIPDGDLSNSEMQQAGREMIKSGSLETLEDLANALVLAVVKAWHFDGEDVPVDLEHLMDVPTAALKQIQDHCAGDEYRTMLNPDFGTNLDEESPTKPSEP